MRAQAQPRSQGKQPIQKTSEESNAAFDQAVKLGDEARQANQLREALDHYNSALKLRPNWKEGRDVQL